jgi:hypothetical protein
MVKLRLLSLICHGTDDSEKDGAVYDIGTEDEPFLVVNNKRVWGGRMGANEEKDLTEVEPISFENRVQVGLRERDPGPEMGYDNLGNVTIRAIQAGVGTQSHHFQKKDASYTLKYSVE